MASARVAQGAQAEAGAGARLGVGAGARLEAGASRRGGGRLPASSKEPPTTSNWVRCSSLRLAYL